MKVIIVSGPTASGKTKISLELARQFGGEIVNFDSLLLYREINIGTAKPTPDELKGVQHHMLDVASISHPMNAADYSRVALPVVTRLLQQNKLVYLVGGSGFYLQALLKGMYESPTTPAEILQKSKNLYQAQGIEPFLTLLKEHDPESLALYHANDHYRVRRAVEHWWTTGNKLSSARGQKDSANEAHPFASIHGWDLLHLHLDLPKDEHLQIIRDRTRQMLDQGLELEVKELLAKGFTGQEKPLQSIGYKEILDHHFGKYSSLADCQERIIISTRQLAKAQRTWFKRDLNKQVFHPKQSKQLIFQAVAKFLEQ